MAGSGKSIHAFDSCISMLKELIKMISSYIPNEALPQPAFWGGQGASFGVLCTQFHGGAGGNGDRTARESNSVG